MSIQRLCSGLAAATLIVLAGAPAWADPAIVLDESGFLDTGEEASFWVRLEQPGRYIFETFGNTDTTVVVRDEGAQFYEFDDDDGWRLNSRVEHFVDRAEAYEVRIRMFSGSGAFRVIAYNSDEMPYGIADRTVDLPPCGNGGYGTEFGCFGYQRCLKTNEDWGRNHDPDYWCRVR